MTPRHPIVLLHGFTQTGAAWRDVARFLEVHLGPPIRTPDLPGHGALSAQPLDPVASATDVVERCGTGHYVGYSMGGRIALHAALNHPDSVRSLVLVSTTAGIEDPDERRARRESDHRLADHLEDIGVAAFVSEWLRQPLFATLHPDAAGSDERLTNTAAGLAGSLRLAGTGEQEPLWARLGELHIPVLIITGSLDEKFTAIGRRLAATIDNAVHEVIPGAGHAVHLEQPATVAGLIAEFVGVVEPQR